jgi:leucyl aminopeptidase
MQLTTNNKLLEGAHRVIIGSSENIPDSISADDKQMFISFLETEDEFKVLTRLNSSIALVKLNDNKEKMRVAGSKIRSALGKEVSGLSVHGSDQESFDFLEGFLLSNYQFNKYFKDKEKRDNKLAEINLEENFSKEKIQELLNITKAVFWARDMVNEPVSYLNAEKLAEEISVLGEDASMNVTVLEKTQIESLKMGGLLGVNQGSIDPPTFTIVEYKSTKATNSKPIVLVGKGVVYDTGGLSLKPTPHSMDIMKSDMGGAAAMAGAMDNRPGLNAYAPGDIVTMFNGTTVEVLNTDAEGRMILADALSYSKKFDPELVIDAATLTGAAHRAVGEHATIIMGNAENKYFDQLEKAGNECFERVIEFPFWEEYMEDMKSSIADLKNIGGPSAGMISAGKFLEHFVEAPYIHMDIAGPAWLDKQSSYRSKGGSGVGVRMVYSFLKNYA